MTIQELAEKCCDVINKGGAIVQLVLPQRRQEYEHYYLAGKKSPKGTRRGCVAGGELVNFEASDVLAFCIVHGAQVTVTSPEGKSITSEELLAEVEKGKESPIATP